MSNTMGNNRQEHIRPDRDYDSSGAMIQARVRILLSKHGCDCIDFNTGGTSFLPTIPDWMQDSITLLNIAGDKVEVQGVGMKWADATYYLTIKGAINEAE